MSSKFSKWNSKDHQNPEDPLRVVFFVSRKKDNKDVLEFEERKQAMLSYIPEDDWVTPKVIHKFNSFIHESQPGELSRMYVSVNRRDPVKIKRQLAHLLVDDNLPGNTPLAHMDSVMVSIAAKQECRAERKWLFDIDIDNKVLVDQFVNDCVHVLRSETSLGQIVPYVHKFPTPHGYAVITDRGFDTRKLSSKSLELLNNGSITLKKDDMLCVCWFRK